VVASGVGLSTEDSPDLADDLVGHPKVRVVGDARSDIIELSDYAYQRTLSRLAGLTDDEYFWEPVPGCCTIRRTESGDYPADDADRPGNPPFTTIAWRLWHLIENYGGKRNPEWLGVERPPGGFERMTRHRQPQRKPLPSWPYAGFLAGPAPGTARSFLVGTAGPRRWRIRRE
jgi:hypothetical protein